ncbi:MAG: TVP38/TMEM64 family protein [Pirellulales bacterium]
MTKSTIKRLAAALLLAAAGAAAWLSMPRLRAALVDIPEWAADLGPWGPVLLAAFYVPASLLFVPGSVVTLVGAFALGMWPALVAVSVGSTLGACASLLVSRYLLRDWLQQKLSHNHKFRVIDAAVAEQGFKIVLLVRLSPMLPYGPLNYAFGLTKVSFRDFALASWLGMLPGTVMYVYLGSAARQLSDITSGRVAHGPWQQAAFFTGLAAAVAVTVLVTRLARRALREAVHEPI